MLAALLLFACASTCPVPYDGSAPGTPEFAAFVEAHLEAMGAPGASVGLIHDGALAWSGGFGEASPDRDAAADTIWMLASVSKLVTAAAVHQLAAEGRLDLDAPINDLLPFAVDHPASEVPITAAMLLEHNSGLRDNDAVIWGHYAPGDPTESLEHWLREVLLPGGEHYDAEKNFSSGDPGASYAYCNTGYALAGFIVEVVAEQPFDDWCAAHIFAPLGMEDTAWMLADLPQARVANPYERGLFGVRAQPHYGFPDYPDGQLRTTVGDFFRFLAMLSHDGMDEDDVQILEPLAAVQLWDESMGSKRQTVLDHDMRGHGGSDDGVHTQAWLEDEGVGYLLFLNRRLFSDDQRAARSCLERALVEAAEGL